MRHSTRSWKCAKPAIAGFSESVHSGPMQTESPHRARARPSGMHSVTAELNDAQSPSAVRRTLRDALDSWGVPPGVRDDVVLVASELSTNAVLHAGTQAPPGRITVDLGPGGLLVTVIDHRPRSTPTWNPPDQDDGEAREHDETRENGRGLAIVAALTDTYGCVATPETKTTWALLERGGDGLGS